MVERVSAETIAMTDDDARLVDSTAEIWYGYGRWDAPYWFIGPEPGMAASEGENLLERCRAWQALGSTELLDCFEHHKTFGHLKWHTRKIAMKLPINGNASRPPTQTTWRQLIRTLLAFKGERTDNDAIGDYQCTAWGSTAGETCAAELSALAAQNLLVTRDRMRFRMDRTKHLLTMVTKHAPRFVVMYGGDNAQRPSWDYIASGTDGTSPYTTELIAGRQVSFASSRPTTFVRTLHPVAYGLSDDYWLGISERLRSLCAA